MVDSVACLRYAECSRAPDYINIGGARMPARSVCLVALSLSEAGPGRFGRQVSVIDIYHTIPYREVR